MSEQVRRPTPSRAWPNGVSGNPAGRKPGTGEVARLRAAIAGHVPSIIEKLTAAALAGDVGAARLLLERALPPMKAVEEPLQFKLAGKGLADQGRAVMSAAANGEMAPAQASTLLTALGTLSRVVEVEELVARIEQLERDQKQGGSR